MNAPKSWIPLRKMLFVCALTLLTGTVFSQIDLKKEKPDVDEAYLSTKQYKRIYDQGAKRAAAGHTNMDWARWQAWKQLARQKNAATQPEPWRNYGPDTVSGRIISIAFHPTDSNTMLVGAASGGLWRTTDYGQSWACLTDDYPTMGVGAVAYNPQNPNTILIATGEGYGFGGEFTSGFGVLKSYDAGASWFLTPLVADLSQSFAGMDIIWHPTDSMRLNVATSFGIYHSKDAAATFDYSLNRLPARMVADPQDPSRIYLAARYYNSNFPGGFYISTDTGATWTLNIVGGLPSLTNMGYASLAVHPVHNNMLFMCIGRSSPNGSGPMEGLYKSRDYGWTWQQINTNIDIMCYQPPYQNICQSWFANTIAISPTDTNRLWAGGTRLWTSSDGGATWTDSDLNPSATAYAVHPDHHQTLFHPLTGDLVDCNDGGVNYTSDEGANWTQVSDGLITHQFYSIAISQTNTDYVLGGTQDVGTFSTRTAHSGGNWKQEFSGDAFGHAIDPTDASIWYATNYINLQRIRSSNAGDTWVQINAGTSGTDQWRMPMEIHPSNPLVLMSSNDNSIYMSSNRGSTWQAVANPGTPIGFIEWDAIDHDMIYCSQLWGGNIYRSSDGGNLWYQLLNSPGSPITDLHADPWDQGTLYATVGSFGQQEQVYRSTNSGLSWGNVSGNLPAIPANTITVDPNDNQNLYVGTDLGVWVSENGGLTWAEFNDSLPRVVVEDLHFYAGDSTLRMGTYGRGYWRTKALQPTFVGVRAPAGGLDLALGPNPAQSALKVRFEMAEIGSAVVTVRNSIGQQMLRTQQVLAAGSREILLDVAALPPGAYIVTVTDGARRMSRPLTIIR